MNLDLHDQHSKALQKLWKPWRQAKIFITGGTGFFGKWLLESHLWMHENIGLQTQLTILSRNPESFKKNYPQFVHPSITFVQGDIRDKLQLDQCFDLIIHGATEASATLNREDPLLMMDVILQGTRNILDLAVATQANRFLMLSSGAVYGEQPQGMDYITEDYQGSPDPTNPLTAYGIAKRTAETLSFIYGRQHGFDSVSARGFAFAGPYLPLDGEFAIGNFVGNALSGKPIEIKGDGQPMRSFLYGEDLAIWLWTLLLEGKKNEAYNLGSDQEISIYDLAKAVVKLSPQTTEILGPMQKPSGNFRNKYLPSIEKARSLGLEAWTTLDQSIQKTLEWNHDNL